MFLGHLARLNMATLRSVINYKWKHNRSNCHFESFTLIKGTAAETNSRHDYVKVIQNVNESLARRGY